MIEIVIDAIEDNTHGVTIMDRRGATLKVVEECLTKDVTQIR